MDIRDFQKRSARWHAKAHPKISIRDQCDKVVEEAVEALEAHSILDVVSQIGAPHYKYLEKMKDNVSHEICDVIIAAINLATLSEVDLQSALHQRMREMEE